MRALVIAHGHPDAGIGGGELAAYNLFRGLRAQRGVEAVRFLARTGDAGLSPGDVAAIGEGEFLWRQDTADWFRHRGAAASPAAFRAFLADGAPDAVFVHHFAHLGIEIFAAIRRALPAARIVATLHDFAAICHNGGLMTRPGVRRDPCDAATPVRCHACFPDRPATDFAARRAALLAGFEAVDRFVSPSFFLKRRYAEWGLDPARVAVVENGLEPLARVPPPPRRDDRIRLGFFGQVREAKGLEVALAALHLLGPAERSAFRFEVNGSRLDAQAAWYRELIRRLRAPLEADGSLDWRGGYERGELGARMAGLDFALVPSTWVENAPIVIQEAFAHGVPVLGADHGGIAEKVRHGIDGLLFPPRDPPALAALLRTLAADRSRSAVLARATRPQCTAADMAANYLVLVERAVPPHASYRTRSA